jgi:hypothetical protein
MTATWMGRAQTGLQLLAAALAAALGLRIMIDAIGHARSAQVAAIAVAEKPALLELADELTARAPPPPIEPQQPEEGEPARSLRLFLSVVVGPERSEVFVNGTRLGLSPYLGDFTCKEGEDLRVQVVPSRGALITRQAKCGGQTLLIRDRPPIVAPRPRSVRRSYRAGCDGRPRPPLRSGGRRARVRSALLDAANAAPACPGRFRSMNPH